MFATILCAVALIGMLVFVLMCWQIADLFKVNAQHRENLDELRQKYANLEVKCNFYADENKKLRDSNNSLSFQLMEMANKNSRRLDHNEGD